MFRGMRRAGQQMSAAESEKVLLQGTSGVLALLGDDDYPYAVPLSYVYHDGKLYFHSAAKGHKLDAIQRCDKASFCVIEKDEVVPEKYTTYFRSVIVFGRVRVMKDEIEIRDAIRLLADRYNPAGVLEQREREIDGAIARMRMIEMTVEHMTGKEAVELVAEKKRDK